MSLFLKPRRVVQKRKKISENCIYLTRHSLFLTSCRCNVSATGLCNLTVKSPTSLWHNLLKIYPDFKQKLIDVFNILE